MSKQITEDYVPFEIAKLLKEKGFDADITTYRDYFIQHGNIVISLQECLSKDRIKTPTHQMAMKWLREEHKIYIDILTYTTGKNIQFRWVGYDKGRLFSQEEGKIIYFDTYEQAVEAALLYVLKNLI